MDYNNVLSTLNREEAISNGASLYGGMLSTIYKRLTYNIYYKYNDTLYIDIDNEKQIVLSNDYIPFEQTIIKRYKKTNMPLLTNKTIQIKLYNTTKQLYIYII